MLLLGLGPAAVAYFNKSVMWKATAVPSYIVVDSLVMSRSDL